MQGQIRILSQIMNYMTKSSFHSCQKQPVCRMFAYVSESAICPLSLCKEQCFKTMTMNLKISVWENMSFFCKCFEKSEDELTWCFRHRDHEDDASLAWAPRWSSLVIVFFNNTLLLLPSWWPLLTDRALENHYLINIFNRPVCLSFLPSGHNYNSQLTLRKRA